MGITDAVGSVLRSLGQEVGLALAFACGTVAGVEDDGAAFRLIGSTYARTGVGKSPKVEAGGIDLGEGAALGVAEPAGELFGEAPGVVEGAEIVGFSSCNSAFADFIPGQTRASIPKANKIRFIRFISAAQRPREFSSGTNISQPLVRP